MTDPLRIPARIWIKTRKPYQKHRLQSWAPPNNVRGDKGQIFTDDRDQYGRDLGFADDLAPRRVDNRGWFADSYQSSTIRGSVTRIRTSRGMLYVPVTGCDDWDGTTHYLADAERVPRGSSESAHESAIRDAAARADHCAELEAEQARDDDIRGQVERAQEEERGVIEARRAQVTACVARIRALDADPFIILE
jgi:hypothetical protein